MKRRALLTAWLLIIGCMLVGLAEEPQNLVCGDYEYRLLEDGTAEITGYTGTETELLIPVSLNEHAVTSIADYAFADDRLTSLILPDSVTHVGNGVVTAVTGRIRLSAGLEFDFTAGEMRKPEYVFPDAITDEHMQSFLAAMAARDGRTIKDCYRQIGVNPVTGKSYYKKADDVAGFEATYPALAEGKVIWVLRKPRKSMNAGQAQKLETAFAAAGYTSEDMAADYLETCGQPRSEPAWYQQELTLPYSLSMTPFMGRIPDGCQVENVPGGLALAWVVGGGGSPADPRCGDFIYNLRDDGTARLIAYIWPDSVVSVPETLDGHIVTAIGGEAFIFAENVTVVSLPDTVTELSPTAFLCCATLTDIRVSMYHPTLADIDGVLFEMASRTLLCYPEGRRAESYQIPQGIRRIAPYAFSGCGMLNKVSLGSEYAGMSCTNEDGLQQLSIPDSVTEIASCAFYGNNSLTGVHIGKGVTSIGDMAFYNCDTLENVQIPGNVCSIGASAFFDCNALRNVTLEEGVTTIADAAFVYCSALEEISLPDSVKELGFSVFAYTALTRIHIGEGITEIPQRAFCGCAKLTAVELPAGLTAMGEEAFAKCKALTAFTIPDGVTVLGKGVFSDCIALAEIHISAGVTEIPEKAFYGCNALVTLYLPDWVTTIGDKAFSGCCGLTKMTLPQSLKSIGFQAFMHCCSLTEVTLPEGLVTIGGEAFVSCWKLESITIPASVTEIVSYPFAACDALSVISVKRGSYAAWWCRNAGLPHIFTDPFDWLLD